MNTQIDKLRNDVDAIAISDCGVKLQNVAQVFGFSELLARANMIPKGMSAEGAVISIIAGARLGLDPFQAVQAISVINGRPALWGDGLLAVVKASGLLEDEKVEYLPSQKDCAGVRVTVKRKGIKTPYVGTFSVNQAIQAGLWGKQGPWAAYPTRMLLARARAFAYRDGFADVLRGFRSAEEERDVLHAAEEIEEVDISDAPTAEAQEDFPQEKPARKKRASAAEIIDVAETPAEAEAPAEAVDVLAEIVPENEAEK